MSRSWFYKRGRRRCRRGRRGGRQLAAEVRRLFAAHGARYGSPRITADLREAGWKVSKNTVAAVMREQGLVARRKQERAGHDPARARAGGGHRTWSSGTSRRAKINTRWYGDGTEIKTGEGKLYLASVLDMASRRVLGFALGEHHDAALACGRSPCPREWAAS